MIKTNAIVISSLKFSDNSLIIKCYTEDYGVQSYLLKGILKTSKTGLKVAYFQPLTQLEIVATNNKKHQLEYIKEAKILYHYQQIHSDMVKNAVAFFLSEMAHYCILEEEPDSKLFHFWKNNLQWFDQTKNFANFHLKFLIDLTYFLGFFPDTASIENLFFDIESGIFVNEHNGHYLLSEEESFLFKKLIMSDLETSSSLLLRHDQRNNLLQHLMKYYLWHLPNFKIPKSWEILRTILH